MLNYFQAGGAQLKEVDFLTLKALACAEAGGARRFSVAFAKLKALAVNLNIMKVLHVFELVLNL